MHLPYRPSRRRPQEKFRPLPLLIPRFIRAVTEKLINHFVPINVMRLCGQIEGFGQASLLGVVVTFHFYLAYFGSELGETMLHAPQHRPEHLALLSVLYYSLLFLSQPINLGIVGLDLRLFGVGLAF